MGGLVTFYDRLEAALRDMAKAAPRKHRRRILRQADGLEFKAPEIESQVSMMVTAALVPVFEDWPESIAYFERVSPGWGRVIREGMATLTA